MLVFKTFLRILNKNKLIIIFFSALLIFFGGFNMKTSQNSMSFQAKKPDILIVNLDGEKGVTKSLINYMSKNCNIVNIENSEEKIDDALFFRDVSYVIYIPDNFNDEFFKGNVLNINIKSTGDYESAYASMLLNRYINVAKSYTLVWMEYALPPTLKKPIMILTFSLQFSSSALWSSRIFFKGKIYPCKLLNILRGRAGAK